MQDMIRLLIQNRSFLWAVFGLGVANVAFAVILGSLTDRWIDMLLHSPRIEEARTKNKFLHSYCRSVERIPMKPATVTFGVLLMALALADLAAL